MVGLVRADTEQRSRFRRHPRTAEDFPMWFLGSGNGRIGVGRWSVETRMPFVRLRHHDSEVRGSVDAQDPQMKTPDSQ